MNHFSFEISKQIPGKLGRAGIIHTPHGDISTPAFITVGTKATVKSLSPEQVSEAGAQAVLANTYHLYLQPGSSLVRESGGIHKFMNWQKPMFTDSGGFQVFSLGAAFGKGVSKVAKEGNDQVNEMSDGRKMKGEHSPHGALASIDEDGVSFRSHLDGSQHRLTPERSIQIQHDLGADIIFAFDECTSPTDSETYQQEALDRTHRWAKRSLTEHQRLGGPQALFGIVQGGRFQHLREESALTLSDMEFDGFGIGGSFSKEDIGTAVSWVNTKLPEHKPRHLLGIGEPIDLFEGVENGIDTFDCVSPTRIARNGAMYTKNGRLNIHNAKFIHDFAPVEDACTCYTCQHYSRAYLSHLFRADEMFAASLASIHNIHFIAELVAEMRKCILDGSFAQFKMDFMPKYYHE